MITVKFDAPIEAYRDNAPDARTFIYPLTVTRAGEGFAYDQTTEHKIGITITRTLERTWDYESDERLQRALFAEVLKAVYSKLAKDSLKAREDIELHSAVASRERLYDPSKIPSPGGFERQLTDRELEDYDDRDAGNIGFRIS